MIEKQGPSDAAEKKDNVEAVERKTNIWSAMKGNALKLLVEKETADNITEWLDY